MDKNDIHKLDSSIPTNDVKIIDLYNKIDSGLLDTQPNYQRKLVWKKQHKFAFIDTILLNFPFPEIYIASSDIDVENLIAKEVVVDGQQRLTTIVDYIKGEGDFTNQKKIRNFNDLEGLEKKSFLNYKVSVKDLKDIGEPIIKEIFQRINSTEYSLNTVEKNNALYGDGEIALFCKQLTDKNFKATENITDIILEDNIKSKVNDFFDDNKIFTENDKKRMYDFQYLMLITSTILEGSYYGRSSKVDEYLEKFNSSFEENSLVIEKLINAISIIESLNFSEKSYWFNKANIFTLLIELSKIESKDNLNLQKLERELLDLEDKVDLYFMAENEEEMRDISEDEKKYFETSRHGSHEKASREHRGKVIRSIINNSAQNYENEPKKLEKNNLKFLEEKAISFSILIPTETGLKKNIMDAVTDVREFFKNNDIHDYFNQELGPNNKILKTCIFNSPDADIESEMSLYRSNGRGDYRIWFKDLKTFAEPNNKLALIIREGIVNILNLTKIDYVGIL